LTGSWMGNRYEFKRTGVKGSVNIQPSQVAVEVDLSIVFSPLKGKVEEAVREKLAEELAEKPQGS
jgi:putative polyhydroxyalkanoate system protein